MDKLKLFYSCGILFISQTLLWFSMYGHTSIEWFKENAWFKYAVAIPITYLFVLGIQFGIEAFGGLTWPPRILTFTMGIISFIFLAWFFNGEPMSAKAMWSVGLAMCIIAIQIFAK